jgi:hypothetical protein
MTYTITIDTLPRFMIDLGQRLTQNKSVLVDFIDEKSLYLNSQEYKDLEWGEWRSGEQNITDLTAMIN